MDKKDSYSIASAIAELGVWEKASRHNWALVSQMAEDPYIALVVSEKNPSAVVGRLLLFPAFAEFRDFILTRRLPDYGVALSPMDFRHFEVAAGAKGRVEIFRYSPGMVPVRPTSDELNFLAPLLLECYGVMLRLEDDPELPLKYVSQNAMFARKELVEGVWQDGPLALPREEIVQMAEQVTLDRQGCEAAKGLPVHPRLRWEVDFFLVPNLRTAGPDSRFLYVLAVVDAETKERVAWLRLAVDGKPGGLKRLWEGHAQRVLDAILGQAKVPGEIDVRSGRMARFLRPLGLHLPFKLVQHARLPALDGLVGDGAGNRGL
ncbi:MAG: hypothetical protein ACI4Q3_04850 [Kiritimatiellia bacterium]